jgi:hypothetical protein
MPSHRGGIGGSGVYALSEAGRRRFGRFPPVTADDAFVRRHFALGERVLVESARSVVTPPRTLAGLIAIKTRSHFGNMELSRRFPQLAPTPGGNARKLLILCLRPWWWPGVAVYSYVKLMARLSARRRIRRLMQGQSAVAWDRDETSRGTRMVAPR